MAGSASTITYDYESNTPDQIKRIKIAWTSDAAAGTVTATTKRISGTLLYVVTDPGTAAPTDNYDITIKDEFAIDVLADLGGTNGTAPTLANRDTTNTEKVRLVAEDNTVNTIQIPGSRPIVNSPLTVAVAAAGNSKEGTIYIYWTPNVRG